MNGLTPRLRQKQLRFPHQVTRVRIGEAAARAGKSKTHRTSRGQSSLPSRPATVNIMQLWFPEALEGQKKRKSTAEVSSWGLTCVSVTEILMTNPFAPTSMLCLNFGWPGAISSGQKKAQGTVCNFDAAAAAVLATLKCGD